MMSEYFPMDGVINMRISALQNNGHFDEQRRVLQRKEAKDAYKKNALYTQTKKNAMLKILEDLLSGKTEKELFEKDQPLLNEESEILNVSSLEMNNDSQSLIEPEVEMSCEIIQQSTAEAASDEEERMNRFSHEEFDFISSEIWSPAADRNILNTSNHKSLESIVYEKTYTKAVSSYTYHMQMAQNGFKQKQPIFSYIA